MNRTKRLLGRKGILLAVALTALLAAGCEVPADTPEENLLAMDRLLYLS